jgi:hypothetical protein
MRARLHDSERVLHTLPEQRRVMLQVLGMLERSCETVRMPTQRIPVGHSNDRDSVASF